jgi:hypothetical protein
MTWGTFEHWGFPADGTRGTEESMSHLGLGLVTIKIPKGASSFDGYGIV